MAGINGGFGGTSCSLFVCTELVAIQISSKEAPMAENGTPPSPSENYRKPTSTFFSCPKLFTSFTSKVFLETEAVMSPTSILDSKPFSCPRNQFSPETNTPKTPPPETKRHWDKLDSKIGLGIVDSLTDDDFDRKLPKLENKLVLFGSQLKIQIPPFPPAFTSPAKPLSLPTGPGAETRKNHLGFISPAKSESVASSSGSETSNSSRIPPGFISASQMELSEDYTCVISHGPIPRTIHIYEDCIIENCCGIFSLPRKENNFPEKFSDFPSENFLSFCFSCKKNLGSGTDIFMYRGEMAFCSHECRYEEMKLEEEMELKEKPEKFEFDFSTSTPKFSLLI